MNKYTNEQIIAMGHGQALEIEAEMNKPQKIVDSEKDIKAANFAAEKGAFKHFRGMENRRLYEVWLRNKKKIA